MMETTTVLTIVGMAAATYFTRIGGYLLLSGRQLSARTMALMDILPGCVLISVIAPAFATGKVSDLAGLTITIFAASRLSLLPTMALGVGSTAILRLFLSH
ncbi:AzlD family protein [Acetobacter sp. DmW_136]|uniref:AzlD family protein n=1 Tax=Acetobacter sp. DmW_136 TaxID=2591091 RepID=UPI00123B3396|nr:AzlD family protein [Acetobacter sp. DmW_136]KAA8383780.1 AzlD family protein [Acetobacter sp. DmW_136]